MFSGIGIWEVLLIIVVVLVVLGPQRVPEIARKLGQIVRTVRRASTDLTTAVSRELDVKEDNPSSTPDNSSKSAPKAATGKTSAETEDKKPVKPEGHQQRDE